MSDGIQMRGRPAVRRARGSLVVLGCVVVMSHPPEGRAQTTLGAPGAMRPSLNSPSMQLDRSFGNSSFGQPVAYTAGRSPGRVARVTSPGGQVGWNSTRSIQSRGLGANRLSGGADFSPFVGGSRLLGRNAGLPIPVLSLFETPPGGLLANVGAMTFQGENPFLRGRQTAADRTRTKFASWGPPELVARRSETAFPQTQPASGGAGGEVPAPKATLQELVKNRLAARMEVYEKRATEAMKAGKYQEACDQLALADASVLNDPGKRIYLKLFFIYAAIGAEEFEQAFTALRWVVDRGAKTGGDQAPAMFNLFRDARSLYRMPADYEALNLSLDRFVFRLDVLNTPAPAALKAMLAWGRNDASNAKYYAKLLADKLKEAGFTDSSWPRLHEYMQLADQQRDGAGRGGETGKRPGSGEAGSLTLEPVPVPSR